MLEVRIYVLRNRQWIINNLDKGAISSKTEYQKKNNNKGRKGNQKWMVFSEAEMAPCHTYPVVCPPEMGIDPGPYSIM